jgi:hypothetical protein
LPPASDRVLATPEISLAAVCNSNFGLESTPTPALDGGMNFAADC